MPACRSPCWRAAFRLLRAVRARAHPTISDLKGKRVGIQTLSSSGHLFLSIMATHVGLDPHKDIDWVDAGPDGKAMELFADRQNRCLSRLPARAAGAARPQDRSRDPQHAHRPAVVAVLLLHVAGNAPSSAIIRSRPSASCARSSRPPILRGRAGAGRATSGRWRVHARYDYALQTMTSPYAVARVRPGGLDAVLSRCACTRRA